MSKKVTLLGFCLGILASGCATTLATRPIPEKVVPEVALAPGEAPKGYGKVTLDVVDGPARAEIIISESTSRGNTYGFGERFSLGYHGYRYPYPYRHYGYGPYAPYWSTHIYTSGVTSQHTLNTKHLCETPCTVLLPYGSYRLRLTVLSDREISDTQGTMVVSEKPSVFRRAPTIRRDKPGMQFAGAVLTVFGWTSAATLAPGIANGVYDIKRGAAIGGTIALVGVGVAGIIMLVKGKSFITPGSQVQWLLSESVPE